MKIKMFRKIIYIIKKIRPISTANFLILRVFLIILLAGVAGWIIIKGLVPSGKISYSQKFDKSNYFIQKFTPDARTNQMEYGYKAINGDPVYFSVRTPRKFNKAILTLRYKNIGELPLIEAGIMTDKKMWQHNLKPVENKIIDQLALVWNTEREGDLILLQRNISTSSEEIKNYKSIQDLKNNLTSTEEIAVYNYNLDAEYLISDYEADDGKAVIDFPVRGNYQFYTYIKEEEMNFLFDFYDLNQDINSDDIDILVYYQYELIDSKKILDEGPAIDDRQITERKPVELKYSNLPEGAYMIVVRASDDIVTKKISTAQSKISFINKLWIYNGRDLNIELYSDSRVISAVTADPAKLQAISIGDKELALSETYKQFSLNVGSGIKKINLEKGSLILAGDGVFSFDKNSIINPNIKKADSNLDWSGENINYIIANYNQPVEIDGWKEAKIKFDLLNAYREDEPSLFGLNWSGEYNFIISIPGLRADDETNDYILIDEINIDFEGSTLLDKFKKLTKKNE